MVAHTWNCEAKVKKSKVQGLSGLRVEFDTILGYVNTSTD